MLTADALYQRAVDHGNAGRHAAARRDLSAARRRNPTPDVSGLITGTWAYLQAETGDASATREAVALCETALVDPRLSPHTRAVLTSQLGLIELRLGEAEPALGHLTTAAARLGDDPERLGVVLLNRGLVHLDRDEVAAAERDFGRAAEAFELAERPVGQAQAQNNQGYAAMLSGDLVAAIRLMDASAPVLAGLSPVSAAIGASDRAEVLLAAGMTGDAVTLLRAAARIYGSRGLRQTQAEAELLLARALSLESPLAAATVARAASRRFRARGSEPWAVRADAVAIGAEIAGGRGGAALRAAAAETAGALERMRRSDDAAALRLQLVRSRARAGAVTDAEELLAGIRIRPSSTITTRLLAEEVRAELLQRAGRRGAVLRRAASGLDALQSWQSSFGSLELQSSAAEHGQRLAVQALRAAIATARPATVFEWSERVRELSTRIARVRPPADPQIADALAELRALRASVPAPRSTGAHREAELRDTIRRSHWGDLGSDSARQRATLDEVRPVLAADDAVLIAHVWTEDRLAALIVAPDDRAAAIVDLGEWAPISALLDGLLADLDMSAARLSSAALRAAVRSSLDARLERLDAALLAPVRAMLGEHRRVLLTPAGALAGVPWTMLPSLRGRSVAVPDSATAWMAARSSAKTLRTAGFAVGPDVERGEDEVRAAAASWLAGAASGAAPAEVLRGPGATTTAAGVLAERVDVLHVAAHGRHAAENPLFSALELADGAWFGYDIDQLARAPQLVVLSSCELGRSPQRWGREALSGSRAWLHAGSRSVIASAAAVADEAAAELLSAAHTHLAVGVGAADALAAAAASTGVSTPFLTHGLGW